MDLKHLFKKIYHRFRIWRYVGVKPGQADCGWKCSGWDGYFNIDPYCEVHNKIEPTEEDGEEDA